MTYHIWGDKWFEKNGDDLYDAEEFIYKYVYKWSRCRLISKEKYGTLRYEHIFPPFSSVRFGPYISLPYPLFYRNIKLKDTTIKGRVFLWVWNMSWLHRQWVRYGIYTTKRAVKKACLKWPNVKKEITADLKWGLLE